MLEKNQAYIFSHPTLRNTYSFYGTSIFMHYDKQSVEKNPHYFLPHSVRHKEPCTHMGVHACMKEGHKKYVFSCQAIFYGLLL